MTHCAHPEQRRARFYAKVAPPNSVGCHLWTAGTDACGYGRFNVGGKNTQAHRVAFEIARGPIPNGVVTMHTCDTPACVNPAHLRLGAHAENMADMARKGRAASKSGVLNGRAKLTAADVRAIRSSAESAMTESLRRGLHYSTIYKIRSGTLWPALEESL